MCRTVILRHAPAFSICLHWLHFCWTSFWRNLPQLSMYRISFLFFSFCHCLLCHLSTQVAAHVYATQQPFVFSKSSNIYSIYHACTCQFSGRGCVTELILRRLDADCNYMYSQSSERDLVWKLCVIVTRVTTNLENLECPGISLNMENSGNSVQPQGKIVTK